MNPPNPQSNQNSFAQLFALPPDSDEARIKKCFEAMVASLEQYGCELQVSIHFINGQTIPQVNISIAQPEATSKPV